MSTLKTVKHSNISQNKHKENQTYGNHCSFAENCVADLFMMPVVLLFTLFAEPEVDRVKAGKLEENSRNYWN